MRQTNIPDVRTQNSDAGSYRFSRKQYERRTRKRQMLWFEGAPCSLCGRPIYRDTMNRGAYERDIEETWCVHFSCQQKALNKLDRDTGMADLRKASN